MKYQILPFTLVLLILTVSALLFIGASFSVYGHPLGQGDATAQQQTIDAAISQRFTQTAQVQQQLAVTQTVQAAFQNAVTATAAFQNTLDAGFNRALTATARAGFSTGAQLESITSENASRVTQFTQVQGSLAVYSVDGAVTLFPTGETSATLWDVRANTRLASFEGVGNLFFCSEHRLCFTSVSKMYGWDTQTGAQHIMFEGEDLWVPRISFNADWSAFVYITPNQMHFWDLQTGALHVVDIGKGELDDSKTTIAAVYTDGTTVGLWDIKTGAEQGVFKGYTPIRGLALSPDGKWLTTVEQYDLFGRQTFVVWLWNTQTGEKRAISSGYQVQFSPDGTILSTGNKQWTILWNLETGEMKCSLDIETQPLRFNVDGTMLQFFSRDKKNVIYDIKTCTERLSDDGNGAEPWLLGSNFPVYLQQPVEFRLRGTADLEHVFSAQALHSNQNWTVVAFLTEDGALHIWNTTGRGEQLVLSGISGFRLSPSGRMAVTWDTLGTIHLWNVQTGMDRIVTQDALRISNPTFSPDESLLAYFGKDNTIRFWDIAAGSQKAALPVGAKQLERLFFSPDGTSLLSYDIENGNTLWGVHPR